MSEPGGQGGGGDFDRTANSISTRGDRLCPPHYFLPSRNSRPSYGPAIVYIVDHMVHYLAECDHVWSFKISHFERYLYPLFSNQTLKIFKKNDSLNIIFKRRSLDIKSDILRRPSTTEDCQNIGRFFQILWHSQNI